MRIDPEVKVLTNTTTTGRPVDVRQLLRLEEGLVHSDVYASAAVFDLEIEKIFHKGWVYVAHESEIPNPGDYVKKHKLLTRWSFPIWLYVTITGVVVYLMISPYYPF